MPRYGRLYANAVLRPLAEQLVDALGPLPGETVCDLMCDGGTLGIALGNAVGRQGRVVLVDSDASSLSVAGHEVASAGCVVSAVVADARGIPVDDSSCARAGSLCTHGFWDGASLFDAAVRVCRPAGIAALVAWDAAAPPLHEAALDDALRGITGVRSPFLSRCLATVQPAGAAPWEATTIRDVVCFDGMTHYWAAMVAERPLAAELEGVDDDSVSKIRDACRCSLQPCTAADGTMRIPVSATLWRYGPRT